MQIIPRPDQRIDDSRDDHAEVIENEGDEIEIEEADQSPIQGSDNDDDQGDFCNTFINDSSLVSIIRLF